MHSKVSDSITRLPHSARAQARGAGRLLRKAFIHPDDDHSTPDCRKLRKYLSHGGVAGTTAVSPSKGEGRQRRPRKTATAYPVTTPLRFG